MKPLAAKLTLSVTILAVALSLALSLGSRLFPVHPAQATGPEPIVVYYGAEAQTPVVGARAGVLLQTGGDEEQQGAGGNASPTTPFPPKEDNPPGNQQDDDSYAGKEPDIFNHSTCIFPIFKFTVQSPLAHGKCEIGADLFITWIVLMFYFVYVAFDDTGICAW